MRAGTKALVTVLVTGALLLIGASRSPAQLERRDLAGYTLLQRAASEGDADRVRELLDRGAHPDSRRAERFLGLRRLLGFESRPMTRAHETPLVLAAERGHVEVLRILLEAGADRGLPAVPAAVTAGEAESLDLLLRYGSPLSLRGLCALAAERGTVDVMRVVLARGADPNAPAARRHLPPLHQALQRCSQDSVGIASQLIEAGADVDGLDDWLGFSPLDWADWHCRSQPVERVLLQAGATRRGGQDARLARAVAWNDLPAVRAALAEGADPSLVLPGGRVLSDLARGHQDRELLRLLAEAQARPRRGP